MVHNMTHIDVKYDFLLSSQNECHLSVGDTVCFLALDTNFIALVYKGQWCSWVIERQKKLEEDVCQLRDIIQFLHQN